MQQRELECLWQSLCATPYAVPSARIYPSGDGFVEYSIPSSQLKSSIHVRTQFAQREGNYEVVDRTVSPKSSIHSIDRRWHFNGDDDSKKWTVLTPEGKLLSLPSKLHERVHQSRRYSVWKSECCVYLAEAVVEKSEWPPAAAAAKDDQQQAKADPFDYVKVHNTFGEQMTDMQWPKAFIVIAKSGKVLEVPGLLEDEIVRDACIVRVDNNQATIMRIVQRLGGEPRLGLIYCMNRPTILELVEIDLDSGELLRRSGRVGGLWYSVTAFGGKGYTLSASSTGMHSSAVQLHCVTPWLSMQGMRCSLISLTQKKKGPDGNSNEAILYAQGDHIHGPMARGESSIGIINTVENQRRGCVLVDFARDPPSLLNPSEDLGYILDLCEVTMKSVTSPDDERRFIALKSLEEGLRPGYVTWLRTRGGEVGPCQNSSHLRIGVFPESLQPQPIIEVRDRYWVAHWGKKTVERVGLFLHGGPSSVAALPMAPRMEMALRGMQLDLLIVANYVGSLGIGVDPQSLMGHCGYLDVEDCYRALKMGIAEFGQHKDRLAVEDLSQEDFLATFEGRYPEVVVIGGSHGGFLGAHLIGQYPKLFKAAVLLNPVIDISAAVRSTDIPDILEYEVDGETDLRTPGSTKFAQPRFDNAVEQQWKASPLRHVANVRASVCLLLGGKDLRVRESQGMCYFRALKACGVDAQLYYYPESCHPIDRPDHTEHAEVKGAMFVNERFTEKDHFAEL